MFDDKSILITGGTGSFGKRFVQRLLATYRPKRIVIYSRDELKQYEMAKVFSTEKYPCMRYFLGDVRDKERLQRALVGVDYVIHAAALKHVPAAEYNPFEFIKTNIIGAQNVIETSIDRGVKRVVALSTDKACNPINLYGATKLSSDKLFVAGNSYSGTQGTRFAVVRYGNVFGSRGSVIPFFMNSRNSGCLPITDTRMTRFWISLDQGIDLVFLAFSKMQGGEIFVPKIPSMKITDLAQALAPECTITITGIRPGEKLHECMIGEDDAPNTYDCKTHFVIQPSINSWQTDAKYEGERVSNSFRYASDINSEWISSTQLIEMLSEYQLAGTELIKIDKHPDLPHARKERSMDMNSQEVSNL